MGYIDYMLHVIPVIPSSCTDMFISTECIIATVMFCYAVLQIMDECSLIKKNCISPGSDIEVTTVVPGLIP
jgi:hypothetical protein